MACHSPHLKKKQKKQVEMPHLASVPSLLKM